MMMKVIMNRTVDERNVSGVMSRHRKTGVNVLSTTLKDMRYQVHNYVM